MKRSNVFQIFPLCCYNNCTTVLIFEKITYSVIAAKYKELKQVGSFYCLNGKVDLSTFEAINTLDEWETKYNA